MHSDLAEQVSQRLLALPRTTRRPDPKTSGVWLDHTCVFHPDTHRSARWQEESQTYFCDGCQPNAHDPEEVYRQVMGTPVPAHDDPLLAAQSLLAPIVPRLEPQQAQRRSTLRGTDYWFEYRYPDGRRSHYVRRTESEQQKQIRPYHPDRATLGRPPVHWPLYHRHLDPSGLVVIIVEGEKIVDALTAVDPGLFVVTAGSAAATRKCADIFVSFLQEHPPHKILLWPDNDNPGLTAMHDLSRVLRGAQISHQVLKPEMWALPQKGDAIDFLEAGRSLDEVLATLSAEPPLINAGTDNVELLAIVERTLTVSGERLVLEASRTVERIADYAPYLWLEATSKMPSDKQSRELTLRLKAKSKITPTSIDYRRHAKDNAFWWRPGPTGGCYRVDAEGTATTADPIDTFLALTPGTPLWDTEVATGSEWSFRKALELWNFSDHDFAMLKAWLICAFCDLQTPILLLRGPAGTGKSTLARFLLGLLEPVCPEIHPLSSRSGDERGFYRSLEVTPGVLLDNVSSLAPSFEDILSRLVTMLTEPIRGLYTEEIQMLQMRRPIILTTISWDVAKGDLASRCIALSPEPRSNSYLSEEDAFDILDSYMPAVRGYIWSECSRYYRGVKDIGQITTDFRVGSFGKVLSVLGYDVAELAQRESQIKSELVNQHDPWLEAVVHFWERESRGEQKRVRCSTAELAEFLRMEGIENPPHAKSRVFHRYLEEKALIFQDFGFRLRYYRSNASRGWEFTRLRPDSQPLPLPLYEEDLDAAGDA